MKKSKDKILIFGNGQIGNFYLDYFKKQDDYKVIMSKKDITKFAIVEKEINEIEPSIVINTAAKTNLEWIKDNKLEAFNVNVLAADNLAKICDKNNIYYIFLSSGCIFESKDKNDVKNEQSVASPQAFYSWTKVWAEDLIRWKKSKDFKYLILRPRQPVSSKISNKNMLIKLLTFTQFVDTPNTGTVLEDLMVWTRILLEKGVVGVVHVANRGWSTPYKIALLLKKHVLPQLEVNLMSKKELDAITPVKRVDTILDVSKLESIVGKDNVMNYEERLEQIIINLANNIKKADKNFIKTTMENTVEHTKKRAIANTCYSKLYS
jgi:dTDP-4-dehydrorhamnose reductase